jgi:hypothetical protein
MRPGSVPATFGLAVEGGMGVSLPYADVKTGCVSPGWQAASNVMVSATIKIHLIFILNASFYFLKHTRSSRK